MSTEEETQRGSSQSGAANCGAAPCRGAPGRATDRSLRRVRRRPSRREHAEGAAAAAAAGGERSGREETGDEYTASERETGLGGVTEEENAGAAAGRAQATAEDESGEGRESGSASREMFSDGRETCRSCGRAVGEQQGSAADRRTEDRKQAAAAPQADTQRQEPEGQQRRRRSTVQIIQKKEKECYCVTEVDYIPRYWTTDLMCCFTTRPQYILLIKRINSPRVTRQAAELATFLATQLNFTVLVEPAAAEEMAKATSHAVPLKTWSLDVPAASASWGRSAPAHTRGAGPTSQGENAAAGAESSRSAREASDRDSPACVSPRREPCRGAAAAWKLRCPVQGGLDAAASATADLSVPSCRAYDTARSAAVTGASRVDEAASAAAPSSPHAAAATSTKSAVAVRHLPVPGAQEETHGSPSSSDTAVPQSGRALQTAARAAPYEKERWPVLPCAATTAAAPLQKQRDVHNAAETTPPAQQQTSQVHTHCFAPFVSGHGEKVAVVSPPSTDAGAATGVSSATDSFEELTPFPGAARVRVAHQFLPLHSAAAAAAAAAGTSAETLTSPASWSSSVPESPPSQREVPAAVATQWMDAATSSANEAAPFSSSSVESSPTAAASASAHPSPLAGTSPRPSSKEEENASPWRRPEVSPQVPAVLCDSIDLVVALGGDGTMLWVSQLFAESVPPVLGVAMGTLGYLTRFTLRAARRQLRAMAACKRFSVNLRCRLKVSLISKDGEVLETFVAFNECVIDRGHSSNLCTLDVFCNGAYFTTVAADGLILATPTGSTAYSMSAGGSMVHPKVPCLLFTPICPHTLSFRPVILPDSVQLRIVAPDDARGSVWIAVDGRSRTQVEKGMQVLVSLSAFPFPMVTRSTPSSQDVWLESLKKTLNWNCRVRQAEAPATEIDRHGEKGARSSSSLTSSSSSSAKSITRSDRGSRDSTVFDSSDSDVGSCDRKGRSDRRSYKQSQFCSKRSSDEAARDSGAACEKCESCRRCGEGRSGRSSGVSRSSTDRSSHRGRNSKKPNCSSALLVGPTPYRTAANRLLDKTARPAEEEDWEEDGTTYRSNIRSEAAAASSHKFSRCSRSSASLHPPRCTRRGMRRRPFGRDGSSGVRRSSSLSSHDSRSSNRSTNSSCRCTNDKDQGRTHGCSPQRSRHASRELRRSGSRNPRNIGERRNVLHRGVANVAQEHRTQSRHAEAQHSAAAAPQAAAAEAVAEEDDLRAARTGHWVGGATPDAPKRQPAQQQYSPVVSRRGPPVVRGRRRMPCVQGNERENLRQQRPRTGEPQIFSNVLSGTSASRPPRAALHCLSRTPAGNAAAAVAAAAPAVAAVAAVSSSPDAAGAPASRRLPATATFISLPAAAAAAARAEEQQAAGVTEQPLHSSEPPLRKQIFLCDEHVILPRKHTLLKYATAPADAAAAVQETKRKETEPQEAESGTDVAEWWLQQQLVLPRVVDDLCAVARVSKYGGACEQESPPQQQYPHQSPQQQQDQRQQQAQHEGELQGQQRTGKRFQARSQQQRTARIVWGEERHERGSIPADEVVRTVALVTSAAAGEMERSAAFIPVSSHTSSVGVGTASAAVSARSFSAHRRRSPWTAAALWERTAAEAHSRGLERWHNISLTAAGQRKKERFRSASYKKLRRSFSADCPGQRQQRTLPCRYSLQSCWSFDRVATVNSWLPSWSLLSAPEVAGEATGAAAAAAAEAAPLYDSGRAAAAEQPLATEVPGDAAGAARVRREGRVEKKVRATTATQAVVLMHKTLGGVDTAVETVCFSPCFRGSRASADVSDEFRSVGLSNGDIRAGAGESRWKTCASKREVTSVFHKVGRNSTAENSSMTCSQGRATKQHQLDNFKTAAAADVALELTWPSYTSLKSTGSQQDVQSVLLCDMGKPRFGQKSGGGSVDSPVLNAMSPPAPPVGGFPAAILKRAVATEMRVSPNAAREHTVAAVPVLVRHPHDSATHRVAVDVALAGEDSAPRVTPRSCAAVSPSVIVPETYGGAQELQQEGKEAHQGDVAGGFTMSPWDAVSAFRPHVRRYTFAEQQVQRRAIPAAGACPREASLQEPSRTGNVHQHGDRRERYVRAESEAAVRGEPAEDALASSHATEHGRAAATARETRVSRGTSCRRISTRSSLSSTPYCTSGSRNGELAVQNKRRIRVLYLRKCFQTGRRMRLHLFLRSWRHCSRVGIRGACFPLLKRRISTITQERFRLRQPGLPATTELILSPPSSRSALLSCPTSAATGGAAHSAAVARFACSTTPHRCSYAVAPCCFDLTPCPYASLSPDKTDSCDVLAQKRQSAEQCAPDDVIVESRNGSCFAWLAAEAQHTRLDQIERSVAGGIFKEGALAGSTCETRTSMRDEQKTSSLLGRQAEHLRCNGSTDGVQERGKRAAGYVHQGESNNTSGVLYHVKEESTISPRQSRRWPSTLQACHCGGAGGEQQPDVQGKKGTDVHLQDKGRGMQQKCGKLFEQEREGAQPEEDAQDLWLKDENRLESKKCGALEQTETGSRRGEVATEQDTQHPRQPSVQGAGSRTSVCEKRVLGRVGGQADGTARLTKEATRRASDSLFHTDTVTTRKQHVGEGRGNFQEKHARRVTTLAGAKTGVLAEDATSIVTDDSCVVGSSASSRATGQRENSEDLDRSRRITCTAKLENAASPACARTRTGANKALSEAAGRTTAEASSKLQARTAAPAGCATAEGTAAEGMFLGNVRPVPAVDSRSNIATCETNPGRAPDVVRLSTRKHGDFGSAAVTRAALGAALPQALVRQLPYLERKAAQVSTEEKKEEEGARNAETSHVRIRNGTLSRNCRNGKVSGSSHNNDDCSGQKKHSSCELVDSSLENADRKSFVCSIGCVKDGSVPLTDESEQRNRQGANGKHRSSRALSALPITEKKRVLHSRHDGTAAGDTPLFHVGCRPTKAAREISPSPQKGESNDSPGPSSGETSPRSLTSSSLCLHPPQPPGLPAQYTPALPPCSAAFVSVDATPSPRSGPKKRTSAAGHAGAQHEQQYTEQDNITTAVAVDVSFSWRDHGGELSEETDEAHPSSRISVDVKRISQRRYPTQSSSPAEQKLETIEEALVDRPTFVREREMHRRNFMTDDTSQENSEDVAARSRNRSGFRRCASSAATLMPDGGEAAEDGDESRGRKANICQDLLKRSCTLSSLRPSSSAGVIAHGTERTIRSLKPSTSVFMLPTDRCTAVVRLVSSASRTSLELFRDVREVTASNASASLSSRVDETTPSSRTSLRG